MIEHTFYQGYGVGVGVMSVPGRLELLVEEVRTELASISFSRLPGPEAASMAVAFCDLHKLSAAGMCMAGARVEATDRTALAGTGFSSAKDLIAFSAGMGPKAADGLLDLAGVLDDHPAMRASFLRGDFSAAEAALVGKGAARDPSSEESLLDTAKDKTKSLRDLRKATAGVPDPDPAADAKKAAEAEAKSRVRFWTDEDGLGHLWADGSPDVLGAVWSRINTAAQARFRAARREGTKANTPRLAYDVFCEAFLDPWTDLTAQPAGTAGARSAGVGTAVTGTAAAGTAAAGTAGAGQPAGAGVGTTRAAATEPGTTGAGAGHPAGPGEGKAGAAAPAKARPKVDLIILASLEALKAGHVGPGETCVIKGVGPVSVTTARSYLGDAALKFVITDGEAVQTVAHMGRHRGAKLRTALAALFDCCVGCGTTMGLQWDHRVPLAKDGPTSVSNLQPLCYRCHGDKTRTDFPQGSGPWRQAQRASAASARRRAARNGAAGVRAGGGAKVSAPRRT